MGRHQVSISQIKSDKSLSWIITLSFHCSIFLGNIDSKTPVFVSIFPSLFPKSFIPKITYTIRKRTTIAYLETKFQFLRASFDKCNLEMVWSPLCFDVVCMSKSKESLIHPIDKQKWSKPLF